MRSVIKLAMLSMAFSGFLAFAPAAAQEGNVDALTVDPSTVIPYVDDGAVCDNAESVVDLLDRYNGKNEASFPNCHFGVWMFSSIQEMLAELSSPDGPLDLALVVVWGYVDDEGNKHIFEHPVKAYTAFSRPGKRS